MNAGNCELNWPTKRAVERSDSSLEAYTMDMGWCGIVGATKSRSGSGLERLPAVELGHICRHDCCLPGRFPGGTVEHPRQSRGAACCRMPSPMLLEKYGGPSYAYSNCDAE